MAAIVQIIIYLFLPLGIVGFFGLSIVYEVRYKKLAEKAEKMSPEQAKSVVKQFNVLQTLGLVLTGAGSAVFGAVQSRVLPPIFIVPNCFIQFGGILFLVLARWFRYTKTKRIIENFT